MNAEQWARVKDVFNAALERKPDERRAYVAEAAAGDESVRLEVERLLDAQPNTSDFIEQPAASTLSSGRVISHYEIGRLLGSGGMGRVYAARDTELGREVALKVPSFDGDAAQSRLRREAQHASRLSHPHVCHIYEVGRADGQMFVAMELVPGRSLSELIEEGPLPMANVRRYGMEIADALAHAHEHGVTHRDLKSTNVIVTPKRGAKVLDFGLARMLDTHQIDALSQSQRSLTDEGLIAGTLPYMAPEVLRGQRGDQRADIWALGVLLYEMVAGKRPFTGATGFEVSAGILHQDPAWPADVPAAMRAIIQRCLEKDPATRYQNAADVQTALEQVKVAELPRVFSPNLRLPRVSRRVAMSAVLFVGGLIAAAIVTYIIRTAASTPIIGNMYGYSLLDDGSVEQALVQFEGIAREAPKEANSWDSLGEGYLANGMPDKALDAYSRALSIAPNFSHSILGRGLALAAFGRYDEALERESPDFRLQAFLLSRVGRYREAVAVLEKGRAKDDDAEIGASSLLTAAWLSIEQKEYGPALEHVRAAQNVLADQPAHSLLVLADLMGGIAEIRAGNVNAAIARLTSRKANYDDVPIESNWVAAFEGEVALAQGRYDEAAATFKAAQKKAWMILGRDATTVFAFSSPSRDGVARAEIARGNRLAAIEEYRRLTNATPARESSAPLEPRDVLAVARLLDAEGNGAAARTEYERFLKMWTNADPALPELTEARQALARG